VCVNWREPVSRGNFLAAACVYDEMSIPNSKIVIISNSELTALLKKMTITEQRL